MDTYDRQTEIPELEQILLHFRHDLLRRRRAIEGATAYWRELVRYTNWLEKEGRRATFPQIDPADVDAYIAMLKSRISPSSAARAIAALRCFVRFAIAAHQTTFVHLTDVGQVPRKYCPEASLEQLFRLDAAMNRVIGQTALSSSRTAALRDRAILHLVLLTGLGTHEVTDILVSDLGINEQGQAIISIHGHYERTIPIGPAGQALAAYLEAIPWERWEHLFRAGSLRTEKISRQGVWERMHYWCNIVGIEPITMQSIKALAMRLLVEQHGYDDAAYILGGTSRRPQQLRQQLRRRSDAAQAEAATPYTKGKAS